VRGAIFNLPILPADASRPIASNFVSLKAGFYSSKLIKKYFSFF